MAKTAFATNDPLTKQAWEEDLFEDSVKEAYFSRFMGTGSNSLVQVKEELARGKGDRITFGIRMRLKGTGVTSGQTLEGNEEKLNRYDHDLVLEEYAHAVRDAGALDRKRAMFSIDAESQEALRDWGTEKLDELCFDAIQANPTKEFFPAGVANAAALGAGDLIDLDRISFIKAWAKTGGNRSGNQIPLRTVRVEGKEYYILLVHPDVMYDLKADAQFQQAMREAQTRGGSNPLFKGATAIWDGVVIHEHENIDLLTNGGGQVYATCVFMGAQSLLWGWGERPEVVAEMFDYKREHGYGLKWISACNKPVFDSLDYGSVSYQVSTSNPSGA